MSYDPDSAGLAATQRSLDLFLEEDFRVRVLRLPDGQDPDAFIRKTGAAEYRDRLRASTPYLDFVLDAAIHSQGSLDNPRNKIQVINAVLPYLAKLPNAVERSDYVFRFARRLRIEDQQLLAEVKRAAQQKRTRLTEAPLASLGAMKFAEKRLLQVLLGNTCAPVGDPATVLRAGFRRVGDREDFRRDHWRSSAAAGFARSTFYRAASRVSPSRRSPRSCRWRKSRRTCRATPRRAATARCSRSGSRTTSRRSSAKIDDAVQRKDDEMLNRLIEQRVLVDRELVSLSRK